jgi:hypothetical protein
MTARQWIQIVAAFVLMCGVVSLPSPGGSPQRLTSLFHHFGDVGAFSNVGLILIGISIVLFVISLIGRDS